jgi:hypothetical protein
MYLDTAEYSQSKTKAGVRQAIKPGTRKRRRESTPPEQLDDDDEHLFQAEEERNDERGERDDTSYHSTTKASVNEADRMELRPRLRRPG